MNKNFIYGDIISYNEVQYIVIKNYGNSGLVKENSKNGILINNFKWNQEGIDCKYIGKINKNNEEMELATSELENFFNKYAK